MKSLACPRALRARGHLVSLVTLFALVLVIISPAFGAGNATPPDRLTYQGYLADADGQPLATNGPVNYNIVFRVYDEQTDGTLLWEELQTVTVDNGQFSVVLGEGTGPTSELHQPLSTLFASSTASDRFLDMTVTIGGNALNIAPRLRFLPSPYAFLARSANTLVSPNGATLATAADGALTLNGTLNATTINGSGSSLTGVAKLAGGNSFTGHQLFNSGNLGLGTANPGFPLTIDNGALGDKISLWGSSGDIYGFGIQGGLLQIHGSSGAHIAFGNGPSASMVETLRIQNNGMVAVDPRAVNNGASLAPGLAFGGVGSGEGIASKRTPGGNQYGLDFYQGFAPRMSIANSGYVGIGTTAPKTTLHVNGVYYGEGNVYFHALEGDGSSGTAYLQARDTSGSSSIDMQFRTQKNGSIVDVLRLTQDGRVGIGPTSPQQATFTVNGSVLHGSIPVAGYVNGGGAGLTALPHGAHNVSIYSTGTIWTGEDLLASSDVRIKRSRGRSDRAADLATLLDIEVTDYTYRDTIGKGQTPQKKVIGQQVEQVFPQAVSQHTDAVPDIFRRADIRDGWVELATDLQKGERVRLIADRQEGIHEVLEVEPGRFRTAFRPDDGRVFVFGREVNDFRVVDYDAIAMLNVSATQELARQVAALRQSEARVAELEESVARVAALEAKAVQVDALERQVTELTRLVAALAERNGGARPLAATGPAVSDGAGAHR